MKHRYICPEHGEFFDERINAFSMKCHCGLWAGLDWIYPKEVEKEE